MTSSQFFGIATILYFLAMISYIAYIAIKNRTVGTIATTLTAAGFAFQSIAFLIRWSDFYRLLEDTGVIRSPLQGIIRSIPVTNLYESLIFFVWCLILAYLVIEWRYKNKSFGAFVTPIAGLALAFIEMSGVSKEIQPLVPALQSNWLLAHVMMSFIAYALFALSFATAIMYLIITTDKRKEASYIFWVMSLGLTLILLISMGIDYFVFKAGRPDVIFKKGYLLKSTFLNDNIFISILSFSGALLLLFGLWRYGYIIKNIILSFNITPELLDEITYKAIAIGFPIFTLGGLIFGAIWADQAWGVYWSWDPKETWSLITWFVYAFYLHSRLLRGWRGRKIAVVASIGFFAVIFTYLGVNLLLSGLHAYGGLK
ncbi:MAG: c-type cytochrome biogenesis protein CcsB [Thermodesulfovibrionales bacterium]|nr:c-type cytochrome biogenesis protein CcsB [Thermodesulfovibrionales bacterium]